MFIDFFITFLSCFGNNWELDTLLFVQNTSRKNISWIHNSFFLNLNSMLFCTLAIMNLEVRLGVF